MNMTAGEDLRAWTLQMTASPIGRVKRIGIGVASMCLQRYSRVPMR
jgi:hypothetical protein